MTYSNQYKKNIALTFTNYNYAFANFYENYKNNCIIISEKTKLSDLPDIRKVITSFIYEYDYAIKEHQKKVFYRTSLRKISENMLHDENISKVLNRDKQIISNKIYYYDLYYKYFLRYLDILGRFTSDLTDTFMPHTNVQRKLLRFSNNQPFFEKFTEHKNIILASLIDFKIRNFASCYNHLITFYYAYNLFINDDEKINIDNSFSLILSLFLNREILYLLSVITLSNNQAERLRYYESILHNNLLLCSSKMNECFSYYDVLPKLQTKIYVDRTLI